MACGEESELGRLSQSCSSNLMNGLPNGLQSGDRQWPVDSKHCRCALGTINLGDLSSSRAQLGVATERVAHTLNAFVCSGRNFIRGNSVAA